MRSLVRRRLQSVSAPCRIPAADTNWLGLHAFVSILTKKQSMYRKMLRPLRRLLHSPCYLERARALLPLTDPRLSPAFAKLKY